MDRLSGKVAVVTGGNSGIGLATAKAFVAAGARVVIFGRSQATLDAARRELGPDAMAVQGDVARTDDLERLFAVTRDRFGKVDVLFVNAGIAEFLPLAEVDEAHFDRVVGINFKGAYFTLSKSLPVLNDGASIILTTSVSNAVGLPATSVYAATKAALRSLVRTFAAELAPRGIRVNAVSPGLIETPILGRTGLPEAELQSFGAAVVGRTPLARTGRPNEIAHAVLFLASPDASYVAGAELSVDGGFAQV